MRYLKTSLLASGFAALLLHTMTSTAQTQEPVPMRSFTLQAPGATLYYEVRGSGPVLLLIPGGPTDAGVFTKLAGLLADRYTVVALDPRGNSRSRSEGSATDLDPDVHGDDAARIIDAVGGAPAFVFGSSGGAQIGLNLAARHPEKVRGLVAHEPPCILLLEDSARSIANNRELRDTYLREGAGAAMQKFMRMNGMAQQAAQLKPSASVLESPGAAELMERIAGNFDYFFAHALQPLSQYRPDVATLRTGRTRIVIGVGAETAGQTAHRTAVALAEQLGSTPTVFPGDHNGYSAYAERFADTLHQALSAN